MLVLGVDPALKATGYGFVEGSKDGLRLLRTGLIQTQERSPLPVRLHLIHQQLLHLLGEYRPALLAVEDLYAAMQYPRTAIILGHVRGVVYLAAAQCGIDVIALPPASVKQAIAGFGAASKGQIQHAVGRLLGLHRSLDRHVADAVAVALTALSRQGRVLGRVDGRRPPSGPFNTGRTVPPDRSVWRVRR